jgi:glycopeptide antibiotics resistance protein
VLKLIGLVPLLLFAVLWVALLVTLRVRRGAGWVHLLLVAIFGVYLYAVLDVTLLQYQSLLLLKLFQPDLILRGIEAAQSLNLVPLVGLGIGDLPTSLLNILMLIPVGFGLPFLAGFRFAQVVVSGALFSLAIEALQLASGHWAGTTFRVADVNDVIFNTTGAAIGYLLFIGFLRLLRAARGGSPVSNPLLRHLIERPQI